MIASLLLLQSTFTPLNLDVRVGDRFEEAIVADWIPLDDEGARQTISSTDQVVVMKAVDGGFEVARKRLVNEWKIDGSPVPLVKGADPISWREVWKSGRLTVVTDENENPAAVRIHRFTAPLLGAVKSGFEGFSVDMGRSGWTVRDEQGARGTVAQSYLRTEPGARNPGYPGRRTVTIERAPMPGGSSQYRLVFTGSLVRFSAK
jgi:hypothetical protein